jgi:hypothetical protein
MRRGLRGAALLAVLAVARCGGSGNSHSGGSTGTTATGTRATGTTSTTTTKSTTTRQGRSRPVAVNKSVVQSAPGGAKVKVTLVSYQAGVSEATNDALAPKLFAINLRLQNLSSKSVKAHPPSYYSVLRLANTAGASTVAHAKGPCSGAFYRSRISLAPHGAAQGCIPYAYGSSRPVMFGFGFALKTANWRVTSG